MKIQKMQNMQQQRLLEKQKELTQRDEERTANLNKQREENSKILVQKMERHYQKMKKKGKRS